MTNMGGKFLLWCVNRKPMLTLLNNVVVSSADNDATIFEKLRSEYRSIRGWRSWGSLYVITEIKFVMV